MRRRKKSSENRQSKEATRGGDREIMKYWASGQSTIFFSVLGTSNNVSAITESADVHTNPREDFFLSCVGRASRQGVRDKSGSSLVSLSEEGGEERGLVSELEVLRRNSWY